MMGTTHVGTGLLAWAAVGPLLVQTPEHIAIGAGAAMAAALGPDLDHPHSKASRALFGPLRGIVAGRIATVLGGHRAGAHSVFAVALVGIAAGLATSWPWLGAAVALGWAAHIVGDMATRDGVAVLWPVRRRRYRYGALRTGGGAERVVAAAQALAVVGVVWLHYGTLALVTFEDAVGVVAGG